MRVRAYAKINLSLRVLGTRTDGYHELRTVFQTIALHDTLTIRQTPDRFVFTCDDPDCATDRSNLVWRAAERLWTAAGKNGDMRGVSIHLAKRIPLKAGLGGGSSDCAAVIRALGRMWRVPEAAQHEIGAALGADVPYFFVGGTALGVDRGDRITALPDQKRAWVVLVVPSFGVSTKEAFSWWATDQGPRTRNQGPNDLERPVAKRHPEIARLVRSLKRLGAARAATTGSGSTVFGLFSRQSEALDAAAALFSRSRRTLVTRTVSRRTCRRELAAK